MRRQKPKTPPRSAAQKAAQHVLDQLAQQLAQLNAQLAPTFKEIGAWTNTLPTFPASSIPSSMIPLQFSSEDYFYGLALSSAQGEPLEKLPLRLEQSEPVHTWLVKKDYAKKHGKEVRTVERWIKRKIVTAKRDPAGHWLILDE